MRRVPCRTAVQLRVRVNDAPGMMTADVVAVVVHVHHGRGQAGRHE